MATKIDKAALVVAAKKIAKLRVETVGGDKSRPAETVQSCLNRGFNTLGSAEGISYILRHAIKYYLGALPTTHGATGEDSIAYWKGAYERMAARNNVMGQALKEISDRHIPDQPAAYGGSEYDWVVRQYASVRKIALDALAASKAGG